MCLFCFQPESSDSNDNMGWATTNLHSSSASSSRLTVINYTWQPCLPWDGVPIHWDKQGKPFLPGIGRSHPLVGWDSCRRGGTSGGMDLLQTLSRAPEVYLASTKTNSSPSLKILSISCQNWGFYHCHSKERKASFWPMIPEVGPSISRDLSPQQSLAVSGWASTDD